MSKYTTEVRFVCEYTAGLTSSVDFDEIDTKVLTPENVAKIFEHITFPIFDENYRIPLETKILQHFYTREIGYETVGLWKLKMRAKLQEIMPYYNQMYESATLAGTLDFFANADYKETMSGTRKDTTDTNDTSNITTSHKGSNKTEHTPKVSTTTTANGESKSATADTPQLTVGSLFGDTGMQLTNPYSTNFARDEDKNTTKTTQDGTDTTTYTPGVTDKIENVSTGKDTTNSEEDRTREVKGRYGSASTAVLLKEMRESFLNIDMMVIEELEPLFMALW